MAKRESQPMSFVPVATRRKTTRRPFCGKAAAMDFASRLMRIGYANGAIALPFGPPATRLHFPWFASPFCGIIYRGGNLIYPHEIRESTVSRPMTMNGGGQFGPDADHQRLANERFHNRARARTAWHGHRSGGQPCTFAVCR
jgi:hypothetical protein